MKQLTYSYQLAGFKGEITLRTSKSKAEAEEAFRRLVIRCLYNAGITGFSEADIEVLGVSTPISDSKDDQEPSEGSTEALYSFVLWSYGNEPGPWHMLAGNGKADVTCCNTSRDWAKVLNRIQGYHYPKGKYCVKCHKAYMALERERKRKKVAA